MKKAIRFIGVVLLLLVGVMSAIGSATSDSSSSGSGMDGSGD